MNNKGFTLIELMIVVVIIGILAAIAIPRFTQVANSAKEAEAAPVLKQICFLAEAEKLRSGANAWPADLTGVSGWIDPGAEHYNGWSFADGVASATAISDIRDASMDCDTRALTLS